MNAYLAHHGIKGQKWGVRRYQNPDGSYTDLGKKRYSFTGVSKKGSFEDRVGRKMLDSESNLSKVHREVGSKLSRNPRIMLANKKAVKVYYKAGRNEDDAAFKKAYENFQTVSQRKAIKFANKYADAYVKDFGLDDAYVKRGERIVAQKMITDVYLGTPMWTSTSSKGWKDSHGIRTKGPKVKI